MAIGRGWRKAQAPPPSALSRRQAAGRGGRPPRRPSASSRSRVHGPDAAAAAEPLALWAEARPPTAGGPRRGWRLPEGYAFTAVAAVRAVERCWPRSRRGATDPGAGLRRRLRPQNPQHPSARPSPLAEHRRRPRRKSLALTLVATAGDNPPLGQDLPMDGAIVFVCDPRVDLEWLRHRGTPVVTVDQTPTKGVPAVNVDDAGGARAAAQHLVDLGHRRIGIVTVGEDLTGRIRPADQRSAGWREALGAAGVEPVVAHANPRPVTAAYDAALELLDRPGPPDGVAVLLGRLRGAGHPRRRGPRPARPGRPVGRRLRRRRLRLDDSDLRSPRSANRSARRAAPPSPR